MEEWKYTSINS